MDACYSHLNGNTLKSTVLFRYTVIEVDIYILRLKNKLDLAKQRL